MSEEKYVITVRKYADMVFRITVNYSRVRNEPNASLLALGDCKGVQDAEDIVQDVFLKLYQHNRAFADEEHLKRWLIRLTINKSKDLLASSWHKRVGSLVRSRERAGFTHGV